MTSRDTDSAGREASLCDGIPIGGVGAGCVELGRDGFFRNLTINNNRTPELAIPISEASFLALRVSDGHEVYARTLQQDLEAREDSGPAPARLAERHLSWRGLYPVSEYTLTDPDCPVRASWSMFAPVIPFDHEAAVMPAILVAAKAANASDTLLSVSWVFNWQNLIGYTGNYIPANSAPIQVTQLEAPVEPLPKAGIAEPRPLDKEQSRPVRQSAAPASRFNALLFGPRDDASGDSEGQYCLAVGEDDDLTLSAGAWDHWESAAQERFWAGFLDRGSLKGACGAFGETSSGAVCASLTLGAGEEREVHFVLTWHCPRYTVQGVDLGNGYANRFKSALQTADHALKHFAYYQEAVSAWHSRLLTSTLPERFSAKLLDSLRAFSTNTLYTRAGVFAMFPRRSCPSLGLAPDRMIWSLAAQFFFPRFAHADLRLPVQATEDEKYPSLWRNSDQGWQYDLGLCAEFTLAVYMEYFFTGHRAHLNALLPTVRNVLHYLLTQDRDRDGFPGLTEDSDYDSHDAGLWLAALRAYAELARAENLLKDAAHCEEVYRRAALTFDRWFWRTERNCYCAHPVQRLSPASAVDPSERLWALPGFAYMELLGLSGPLPAPRVAGTLQALVQALLPSPDPIVPGLSHDPGAQLAWLTPMLIRRGQVDDALRLVDAATRQLRRRAQAPPEANVEAAHATDPLVEALAVWHVFSALQGFCYDVPKRQITFAPKLPEGVHTLRAPLFTPLCMGWMTYHEVTGGSYQQHIRAGFDSPVMVESVLLYVPEDLAGNALSVQCLISEQPVPFASRLDPDSGAQRLTLSFSGVMTAAGELSLRVDQTPGRR